jgi:hypothetical protein
VRITTPGQPILGDLFRAVFSTSDVEAYGVNSGKQVTVVDTFGQSNQIFTAKEFTQIVPSQGIKIEAAYPLTPLVQPVAGGSILGVIKLSNPGDAHIIIDNLNFTDAGAHTAGSNPTYKLSRTAEYDISDVVNPYVPLVADILKGNNSLNFTDLAIAPYF